jgi:hypothetical protein
MPFSPDQVTEIQNIIDTYYAGKKKRIPDLAKFDTYGELSLLDRAPVWMNAVDKTVWADFITLKALLTTGGSGSIAPVLQGDTIIHVVTSAEAGSDTVLIPDLAGKTFLLRLEGRPVLPTEFQILNAGGFKMLGGYTLSEDQRFDLQVYDLQSVPTGGPASLSSSFIIGKLEVSSTVSLNGVNDANKIINIRAASAKITITLPDIATTPTNAVFILESQINNQFQAKLQSTGGQAIYMNNSSRTSLWIGKGETVWVFRNDDGWIVCNDFGNYYKNIGKPYASYSYEDDINELLCDGSDVLKSDVPRLWAEVQTFGTSLTNDPAVYAGNRGMWLDKDSDTLSLPDLREMFLRGVKGGTDTERSLNAPGGLQTESIKKFWPGTPTKPVILQVDGTQTVIATDNDGTLVQPNVVTPIAIDKTLFGTETRPVNTGVFWVVKY